MICTWYFRVIIQPLSIVVLRTQNESFDIFKKSQLTSWSTWLQRLLFDRSIRKVLWFDHAIDWCLICGELFLKKNYHFYRFTWRLKTFLMLKRIEKYFYGVQWAGTLHYELDWNRGTARGLKSHQNKTTKFFTLPSKRYKSSFQAFWCSYYSFNFINNKEKLWTHFYVVILTAKNIYHWNRIEKIV